MGICLLTDDRPARRLPGCVPDLCRRAFSASRRQCRCRGQVPLQIPCDVPQPPLRHDRSRRASGSVGIYHKALSAKTTGFAIHRLLLRKMEFPVVSLPVFFLAVIPREHFLLHEMQFVMSCNQVPLPISVTICD